MNLGTKVSLGVSSVLIFILVVSTFGFVSYQTSFFDKTLLHEAEERLSIMEAMHTHAMLHRGPNSDTDPVIAALNDTLDQLSRAGSQMTLWFVMGPKVIAYQNSLSQNQYLNEPPRDAVDSEAIASGESVYRVADGDVFRLTRPVVLGKGVGAHAKCAECHGKGMGIRDGEVIGAYSIALSVAAEQGNLKKTKQLAGIVSLLACLTIAAVCFYMIRRLAAVPIAEMTTRMGRLAAGDLSLVIPYGDRPDEIGDMARSVQVFKENAIEKQRVEAQARQHEIELATVLRRGTVGELASSLVHELSQPLGTITTYSGTLVSKIRGGTHKAEESVDILEKINDTAHRASQISKTIARHVRGMDSPKTEVDLDDLFQPIAPLIEADARENGVRVTWEIENGGAKVLVNATEIESVIMNLAHNSIEAMEDVDRRNRILRVSASVEETFAVIAVMDTGKGMSQETLDRLFEPFFTTKTNGMGMGLAICRTIVEHHGGQILLDLAQAQRPTIRFTIPLSNGANGND